MNSVPGSVEGLAVMEWWEWAEHLVGLEGWANLERRWKHRLKSRFSAGRHFDDVDAVVEIVGFEECG